MKKVRVTLAELFRSKPKTEQAAEGESTEGKSTEGKSTEGESTEGEATEGESTEGESTEGESTEGNEDILVGADEVVMTASDVRTLRADAGNWHKAKAELETLRGWKASMDGISGGLGQNDQSTRNRSGASILDTPWNQAAVKAAEKVK